MLFCSISLVSPIDLSKPNRSAHLSRTVVIDSPYQSSQTRSNRPAATARGISGYAPDLLEPGAVLAAAKDAARRPLGGRLRRSMTAAARDATTTPQAGAEKRRLAELRNIPYKNMAIQILLNLTHNTTR
jgi:hypothetical protein